MIGGCIGWVSCAFCRRHSPAIPIISATSASRVMMNSATAPEAEDGHDDAVLLLKTALPVLDESVPVTAEHGSALGSEAAAAGPHRRRTAQEAHARTIGMRVFIGCHSRASDAAALEQQ